VKKIPDTHNENARAKKEEQMLEGIKKSGRSECFLRLAVNERNGKGEEP
jgi:hypothetical protein